MDSTLFMIITCVLICVHIALTMFVERNASQFYERTNNLDLFIVKLEKNRKTRNTIIIITYLFYFACIYLYLIHDNMSFIKFIFYGLGLLLIFLFVTIHSNILGKRNNLIAYQFDQKLNNHFLVLNFIDMLRTVLNIIIFISLIYYLINSEITYLYTIIGCVVFELSIILFMPMLARFLLFAKLLNNEHYNEIFTELKNKINFPQLRIYQMNTKSEGLLTIDGFTRNLFITTGTLEKIPSNNLIALFLFKVYFLKKKINLVLGIVNIIIILMISYPFYLYILTTNNTDSFSPYVMYFIIYFAIYSNTTILIKNQYLKRADLFVIRNGVDIDFYIDYLERSFSQIKTQKIPSIHQKRIEFLKKLRATSSKETCD